VKTVFADTFYFLALLDSREKHHEEAVAASRNVALKMVTTEWVLAEFADAYSHPKDRADFISLYRALLRNPRARIVPAQSRLFQRGVDFFEQRDDKNWSLTDCLSFLVMRDEGIEESLTGDKHFEQAGFVALLK
jgi:predicted nucleic acid-binding protein